MGKISLEEMSKFFKDNIEEIGFEIEDINSLYEELKTHFDNVKKSYSPGSLTFISKQTTNLSAIKTNKANLMKLLIDIKKMIVELSIKTNAEDTDSGKNAEILKALNGLLLQNSKDDFIKMIKQEEENNEEDEEQDYEALLEKRLGKNNKGKKKKKKKELIYGEDYFFVVDLERNIYAIDGDYNLIEDNEDIEYPEWIIDYIEEDDGSIKAYNEDGYEIEIIEFDED